jgi:hypothetical protein
MFSRSKIRYACYRKQNSTHTEEHQVLLDDVEKALLPTDTWEGFSDVWDIFVGRDKITRIIPEVDFDFIHTTCTEIKVKTNMGISDEDIYKELSDRQKNIYNIVLLNSIEPDFSKYGETWKVIVDQGSKRIEVRSSKTKKNQVNFPQPPKVVPLRTAVHNETIDLSKGEDISEDSELIRKLKDLLSKEGIKL